MPKKGKRIVDEIAETLNIKYKNQCGIVYCLSRNECDTVASDLSKYGIKVSYYYSNILLLGADLYRFTHSFVLKSQAYNIRQVMRKTFMLYIE